MATPHYITTNKIVCCDCKLPKDISEFYLYDGKRPFKRCKSCTSIKNKNKPKPVKKRHLPDGYVYFVLAPEVNRIKIGFTQRNNPLRLRNLKAGSPIDIKLIYVMEGSRATESDLHKQFKVYRHHGEWFDYSEEIKSFLEAWIKISPNDPKRHDLAP